MCVGRLANMYVARALCVAAAAVVVVFVVWLLHLLKRLTMCYIYTQVCLNNKRVARIFTVKIYNIDFWETYFYRYITTHYYYIDLIVINIISC